MARDHDFNWGDFLLEIFAWWRGNTWGTRLWIAMNGEFVGEDERGNRYYRSKPGKPVGPNGYERRMVIYANGVAEASEIPPGWHGWMHYRQKNPPVGDGYLMKPWQKPHQPNLTGTAMAYRPEGSLLAKGERPRVTGDYDAWSPE